jgi:ADP-dependent NAD(P)H-hydrate dehydratase / NAD(P)H-hydrate epimerase
MVHALTGPILTAAQMRAAESRVIAAGVDENLLMARAGAAIAETVRRFGGGQSVLIACGPGNNGGDGYVAARLLKSAGVSVRVAALCDPRAQAAIAARSGWDGPVEALATAEAAPVFVDALFGTGLSRPLGPEIARELRRLSDGAHFTFCVDVPSGVGCDDGADLGAIHGDLTIALGALKPAHLLFPAAGLCGKVICAEIGVGVSVDVHVLGRPRLRTPEAKDHKYTRGLVTVICGKMVGAAVLAASAAQRAGAGYVVLSGSDGQAAHSVVRRPFEEAVADPRLSAIVIGCGLGQGEQAQQQLDLVIAAGAPLVVDADGLVLLGLDQLRQIGGRAILTPHEGEFLKLFGTQPGSKIDRALAAAARSGCTIILKGGDTIIAAPDGRACVSAVHAHWLSSAGTGDVLAGICGAMLAQIGDPFEAACAAVWLHSEAGKLAGPALIAEDLISCLPSVLEQCL